MQIAVIIIFFVLVVLGGFCLGLLKRSKRENVFYIISILLSLTVLLIRSL